MKSFIELEISKIKTLDNSRVETKEIEVAELMNSIKANGLLQPIGVQKIKMDYILYFGSRRLNACKKLGWKTIPCIVNDINDMDEDDFIIKNTVENIQREDITAHELGRVFRHFHKKNFSISEIAEKFSVPKSRVVTALNSFGSIPIKYEKDVIFSFSNASKKKGKIPVSVILALKKLGKNVNTQKKEQLLDVIKREEMPVVKINLLTELVRQGLDIDDAISNLDNYSVFHTRVIFNKKEFEELLEQFKKKFEVNSLSYSGFLYELISRTNYSKLIPDLFKK